MSVKLFNDLYADTQRTPVQPWCTDVTGHKAWLSSYVMGDRRQSAPLTTAMAMILEGFLNKPESIKPGRFRPIS